MAARLGERKSAIFQVINYREDRTEWHAFPLIDISADEPIEEDVRPLKQARTHYDHQHNNKGVVITVVHHHGKRPTTKDLLLDQPLLHWPFEEFGNECHWAVIDSTLYWVRAIGRDYSRDLFICDLAHPSPTTVSGPNMHSARRDCHTLALDRKLYVLGGTRGSQTNTCKEPWAEVFDPVGGFWAPLPDPPASTPHHLFNPGLVGLFRAAVTEPAKEIIVGSFGDRPTDHHVFKLSRFHVETNVWSTCFIPAGSFPMRDYGFISFYDVRGRAVTLGRTLVWLESAGSRPGPLLAYNQEEGRWYRENGRPILDLCFYGVKYGQDYRTPPRLAHVAGNLLCVLWVDSCYQDLPRDEEILSRLHCVKFRVSFMPEDQSLTCRIVSCESRLIRGFCDFVDGTVI